MAVALGGQLLVPLAYARHGHRWRIAQRVRPRVKLRTERQSVRSCALVVVPLQRDKGFHPFCKVRAIADADDFSDRNAILGIDSDP